MGSASSEAIEDDKKECCWCRRIQNQRFPSVEIIKQEVLRAKGEDKIADGFRLHSRESSPSSDGSWSDHNLMRSLDRAVNKYMHEESIGSLDELWRTQRELISGRPHQPLVFTEVYERSNMQASSCQHVSQPRLFGGMVLRGAADMDPPYCPQSVQAEDDIRDADIDTQYTSFNKRYASFTSLVRPLKRNSLVKANGNHSALGESRRVIVTFQPGTIGITNIGGRITKVKEGGQAQREGVEVGWRIQGVEGQSCENFDDALFQKAYFGDTSYRVTFDTKERSITLANILGITDSRTIDADDAQKLIANLIHTAEEHDKQLLDRACEDVLCDGTKVTTSYDCVEFSNPSEQSEALSQSVGICCETTSNEVVTGGMKELCETEADHIPNFTQADKESQSRCEEQLSLRPKALNWTVTFRDCSPCNCVTVVLTAMIQKA